MGRSVGQYYPTLRPRPLCFIHFSCMPGPYGRFRRRTYGRRGFRRFRRPFRRRFRPRFGPLYNIGGSARAAPRRAGVRARSEFEGSARRGLGSLLGAGLLELGRIALVGGGGAAAGGFGRHQRRRLAAPAA